MRILVLEDDVVSMKILTTLLSRHAQSVDAVHTPESALQLLRRDNYDVVVTDLMMQGMNGVDFIAAVLDERLVERLRIFVVTGTPENGMIIQFIRKQGIKVLFKPVIAQELTDAIKAIPQKNQL